VIRQSDILWWVQEARKDPESAPKIIETLAERLVELDAENESLRDQLIQLRAAASESPTSPDVDALHTKIDTLQTLLDQQSSTETAVVLISDRGHIVRLPVSQVRLRIRNGEPALDRGAVVSLRSLLLARPHDEILLLTNRGRAARPPLAAIPFLRSRIWPDEPQVALEAGEQVTAAAVLADTPRFWTVVTRHGVVRQFLHVRLQRFLDEQTPIVPSASRADEPACIVNGDRGDLLLITRWGRAVRFPQRSVDTQGVLGLELEQDDAVVGALPLPDDSEVIAVTASGALLRRDTTGFARQTKPGGSGRSFMQAFDVLNIFAATARGRLLFLTYGGTFATAAPGDAPIQIRPGRGTQILDLSANPAVAVIFVPGGLFG
jgi:DNA gyrase/topoisomerase IV subunit A